MFEGRDETGEMTFRTSGTPADDPFLYEWIASKSFTQVCDYDFRRMAHINVQEAVALRTLIKYAVGQKPLRGTRVPVLLDSRVCQQVVLRGRSSSAKLNSTYLRMCPYLLFGDIYVLSFWVPSEHNPSDDGSRGKSIRLQSDLPQVVRDDIVQTAARYHVVFAVLEEEAEKARTRRARRRGEEGNEGRGEVAAQQACGGGSSPSSIGSCLRSGC